MEITARQIRSKNEEDEDTIEDSTAQRKTGLNRETSRKGFELGRESDRTDASNCSYRNQDFFEKSPVERSEAKYKDDSDYVRDSTETNSSGGSSSTSGYVPTKVRRVHRAIRNKNTGTMEVRRNPMRMKKKEMDKNFSRPRQRLLSAKRKTDPVDFESGKRTKVSTMPYMNTRSVTRKMYNVGATYQAPTIRDETQWKEWPVHGMHERPVFHPQVGLAVEYLGKFFTSLDGLSYQEIVDRPEIEVVSVDPHCEFLCSNEKKRRKSQPSRVGCPRSTSRSNNEDRSFVRCMHGSFHCVLGYCSQVMSPVYKTDVEERIGRMQGAEVKLKQEEPKNFARESPCKVPKASLERTLKKLKENEKADEKGFKSKLDTSKKDSIIEVSKEGFNLDRGKLHDKISMALSQNNPSSGQTEKQTRHFPMYISNPQKIAFASSRTLQGGQVKSPLILLNATDAKSNVFRNRVNLPKEDIQDYSQTETVSSSESPSVKTLSFKTAKRMNDFGLAKYYLGLQRTGELKGKESASRSEVSKKESATTSFYGNKTWSSNETSEIARILSEYNKSNTKKPAIENLKMSSQHMNLKPDTRKEEVSYVQTNSVEKNMNIKFLPGKWRRFHFTVEKLKDAKVSGGAERNVVKGIQVRQLQQKDQPGLERTATSQMKEEVTNDTKVERNQRSENQTEEGASSFQIKKEEEDSTCLVTEDENKKEPKLKTLQDLLENTALLYCAAAGVHQDDLAEYIDSLDTRQSIQWLETWKNNAS